MNYVSKALLTIFLIAVPFMFAGFGQSLLGAIKSFSPGESRWQWFLIGFALFFPVYLFASRVFPSVWNYLAVFEHELTHLLAGLIFLKIPVGFRVTAHQGGEVRHVGFGTTGQTWITLAPYFFPTVALFVLVFAVVMDLRTATLIALLGWTTAFHLVTNWAETSFRQPDLKKAGFTKSILILPVMNLLCYGSILSFVAAGSNGFLNFWSSGFGNSVGFAKMLWNTIFGK